MARPERQTLDSQLQAWDAVVNANFQILFDGPLPVFTVANEAALSGYPASSYTNCIVITEDTHNIFISDGAAWNQKTGLGILDYTTSEQDTGYDFVPYGSNGRVYQKTFYFSNLSAGAGNADTVAHGLSIYHVVRIDAVKYNPSTTKWHSLSFAPGAAAAKDVYVEVNATNVEIWHESDLTGQSAYVTVWYTKT